MLFNSAQYLIFLPVVLAVYYAIPKRFAYIWLLISSYYFYMCWNAKYAVLMLVSTAVTYASGLLLEKCRRPNADEMDRTAGDKPVSAGESACASLTDKKSKWIVAGSFIINIGILFLFKYYGFAAEIAEKLFGLFGASVNIPTFDVLLPVGISFYTFQALSYTMDVYRRQVAAEKNFLRYALYVSFFPQLVAGPIERSGNLLTQLRAARKFDFDKAREGLLLILYGFFMKLVIADRIAIYVDTVYGNYRYYGGWYLIVAALLFAVQLYCDFYGYSTIAMGSAKMLGIELMENFDAPFLSTSFSGLWRRWHISLSAWFRDYLYLPLGGNRKGKLRTYFNKLLTCFVSGLWHGANFTYAVWGLLVGIIQIIEGMLKPAADKLVRALKINRSSVVHRIIWSVITFVMFAGCFVFFRSTDLMMGVKVIYSCLKASNPWILFDGSLYGCGLDKANFNLLLISMAILLFADICKKRGIKISKKIAAQDAWAQIVIIALAVTAILVFGVWGKGFDAAAFIYFRF